MVELGSWEILQTAVEAEGPANHKTLPRLDDHCAFCFADALLDSRELRLAPTRSRLFEIERDLCIDAVLGDFTVLDCRFEFFYVNRADVAERLRRFADGLLRGVVPAFFGLRQHFDDFDKFGHDDVSFSKEFAARAVWGLVKTLPNLRNCRAFRAPLQTGSVALQTPDSTRRRNQTE